MISNQLSKIYFVLAFIFISNFAYASMSKHTLLIGKIVSFDQTHVKISSGDQQYIFSKKELDLPVYVVGNQIEIPFDAEKINQAKVKKGRASKKIK